MHNCQILKVIYKCINPIRMDLAVATPGLHARARACAHTLTPREWVSGLAQMCARACPCAGILSYISCAMSACRRNIRNGMHASPRQHANASSGHKSAANGCSCAHARVQTHGRPQTCGQFPMRMHVGHRPEAMGRPGKALSCAPPARYMLGRGEEAWGTIQRMATTYLF